MKHRLPDKFKHSRHEHDKGHSCSCCYAMGMTVFHKLKKVPVNSVLNLKTRELAFKIPRGNISLGFCENCGFISNVAFDSTLLEYSEQYESTQSFSPTYNTFARRLAEQLIDHHNLHGKDLLEIGCGNGEFLTLLCELGDNRGIGFDPAYIEGRSEGRKETRIKFIKDFYSEKYANYAADFVYCRMTLEHIHTTAHFTRMIRQSIGERMDTIVFFQVPDVTRIIRDCAFEDIYYEHCSYFSPESLAGLFRICGFDVLNLVTDYDGQYVMIEAKPADETYLAKLALEEDLNQLQSLVKNFPEKFQKKTSQWKNQLKAIRSNGQRVVLWGSGSKGVAFLTTLGIKDEIEYVVDINPHRQKTYMAGTGHEIVAPDFLKEYKPDVVIVMNAVYKDEISKDLNDMGLSPEILTL
jgi:SAM-dependent methyltransferase